MEKIQLTESPVTKFIGVFSGIVGIAGFIVTIIPVVRAFQSLQSNENLVPYADLFYIMGAAIVTLVFSVIFMNIYYANRVRDLQKLPYETEKFQRIYEFQYHLIQSTSKTFHNYMHDKRYIMQKLLDITRKYETSKEQLSSEECLSVMNVFELFMINTLSDIKNYFDRLTEEDCAACIKIIKSVNSDDSLKLLKTWYRDPNSYRYRKIADIVDENTDRIVNVKEHTSYDIIVNRDYKRTTFICEDLKSFDNYENPNPHWNDYYNACAVVPISFVPDKENKKKRIILGFICVDNMEGGFASRPVVDFLSAYADGLYTVMHLFREFSQICEEKGVSHVRLKSYGNWNRS